MEVEKRVDEVHKAIVETDDRHLPPAWMVTSEMFARRDAARAEAPKLEAQLAAVRNARDSALLGAVYARDAAKSATAIIQAAEAQKRSTTAWEACKDVAPGSPAPPTQTTAEIGTPERP